MYICLCLRATLVDFVASGVCENVSPRKVNNRLAAEGRKANRKTVGDGGGHKQLL